MMYFDSNSQSNHVIDENWKSQTFHSERRLDSKNIPYIFKTIDVIPIEIPFMIINKTYVQTERHTDMRMLLQNLNLSSIKYIISLCSNEFTKN
jgi:hypothetical protein